jgi:steroid 5-alpha reductase family enzyme
MTTLTGTTEMQYEGTVAFPPHSAIFGGCAIQLGTLYFVWTQKSPLSECLVDSSQCWSDPWSRVLLCHLAVVTLVWLYSLRTIPATGTSDPSIVDRLWSNLPWIYTWVWAYNWPSARLFVMATCATAWGLRLSYNFVLKGGFSGGEDYRWIEVRKWFVGAPWYFSFEAFNLLFVVGFQLLVVLAFTSPAALGAYDSAAPFGVLDYVATALFAIMFTIETVADHQMYVYQTEKYRRKAAGEPAGEYARGFIETGLWAYSRHPNYVSCNWAELNWNRVRARAARVPTMLMPTRPDPTW